ncbi:DUF4301 family protein [Ulvibacter litoralis]|uniref:DUF4301 domain-containing protein n=1 Tax=Ulvibacter litoralis TaxID=227084 RepID=A0A1G7CTM8_9FLAO|nr:DUF4301 family protein [Ulvibacter litoralis]GHC46118.1 hypothetical protein GCM10008083_06360 [Ulvibacter litoralis]SDE42649.1 protein of unknown function [Ulvibacter litoralis]
MLTNKDLEQIERHGLCLEQIEGQIETFKRGIPYATIVTAASVGNGIEVIGESDQQKLVALFESRKVDLDLVKFVPASGAATRMFRFLHEFLDHFNPETDRLNSYLKKERNKQMAIFIKSLKDFAFVNTVRKKIRENYPEYRHGTKEMRAYLFVNMMLGRKGLNFNSLPKGLIPFHKYTKYSTTAFEEQLYEAAFYASAGDEAFLHFTFAEKHVPFFKAEFEGVKKRVSKKTKTEFHISYSFQKKETDTIAVNLKNEPLRDRDGNLIFRPSGHGALIENLNDVDGDIIFIKNIDNVVTEELVDKTAYYKKVLAGKLLWLQDKVFGYLNMLLNSDYTEESLREIKSFLWNALNIKDIPSTAEAIITILNRPIRICGMVKNTGAPGGGPFWVKDAYGETSLQIVELSQIDLQDEHQKAIASEATHFNPVDIVCGVRDYTGKKFDLTRFTDPFSGFITNKSQDGVPLKALELPGLWNGAMANWNTAFVEVPQITFNPVKTVNDLLTKEHSPTL